MTRKEKFKLYATSVLDAIGLVIILALMWGCIAVVQAMMGVTP